MESVCIVDWNGTVSKLGITVCVCADWYPSEKVCKFGGVWGDVPLMPCEEEPTEEQVEAWVRKYAEIPLGAGAPLTKEQEEKLFDLHIAALKEQEDSYFSDVENS